MNFSTFLIKNIEILLEKQRPYLWILLYLSFIYILSGTLFFEICIGLKIFRDPLIYLKCSFIFKVLFKISLCFFCYSILCPFGFMLGFSKQWSKTFFFDLFLSFFWGGMTCFIRVLYEFYDSMFYIWGGQMLMDQYEEYKQSIKKFRALSPRKSTDPSEIINSWNLDQKNKALELADESKGITLLKTKDGGRTRLLRLVTNNGFSLSSGLKVIGYEKEDLNVGIVEPCFGVSFARTVACAANFSSKFVGVIISRPSSPEGQGSSSPVSSNSSSSDSVTSVTPSTSSSFYSGYVEPLFKRAESLEDVHEEVPLLRE